MWLQPSLPHDSNVFLAFSTPENLLQLTLHQYRSSLIMQPGLVGHRRAASTTGTDNLLRPGVLSFVAISSGKQGTAMYLNGAVARSFPGYSVAANCRGRLVLGTSPVSDAPWHGQFRGLALYAHDLSADQVRRHYESWTMKGSPDLTKADRAVALYVFNERSGSVIHNAVPGGINLEIPRRYTLIHQIFLQPFWQEYQPRWSYWKDFMINVLGFIPLGFFFHAYWRSERPIRFAALVTTILGFAVSLTIEVLQYYLPTRDSGTTDLFTNTLGTVLGIQLYRWGGARALVARIYSFRNS